MRSAYPPCTFGPCGAPTHLEYLDRQEEAEEKLVLLEQTAADVDVHRLSEAVVEIPEPLFELRRRRGRIDRLAE